VRIIGGKWRGRQIKAPPGAEVRPTGDRVREAWMSILGPRIPRARVLDLFAGSGALGLEALSRGADRVEFVETAPRSIAALDANIALLDAAACTAIHRADATRFVEGLDAGVFDVAFADPPYRTGLAQQIAERWAAVPFANVLGIEHPRGEAMPPGGDTRSYGTSAVTFYRRLPGE
jgi:16S rRNA (guanine966-N2)-methyltransferase